MPFAAAGAAAVSAGIGLAGSALQSSAASKAGGQAQAALTQSRNDLLPWMTTGGNALGATSDLLGLNGQDAATKAMGNFQASPGYQFSLSEGLRGVDAGAAAKGMLRSGATLKAEQTFGTGLADQEFQQYYKNLAGLSGQGLDAARAEAGVGRDSATAALGSGNAQSSIFGNAASGLGSNVNNLLSNKDFQSIFKSTPGGAVTQSGYGSGGIFGP